MKNHAPSSLFTLNVITLCGLGFICYVLAGEFLGTDIAAIFDIAGTLFAALFLIGLIYGVTRTGGVRFAPLDELFERFPLFWLSGSSPPSPSTPKKSAPTQPFVWHSLFSFKYLRYAGILLIITALFSLMFNIEWELWQKIAVCLGVGAVAFILAEVAHRFKKKEAAVALALTGFALVQFGVSLLVAHPAVTAGPALTAAPAFWLAVKLFLSLCYLAALRRYPAPFHTLPFAVIAWLAPLSLASVDIVVPLSTASPFILGLTLIVLAVALLERNPGLLIVNLLFALYFALSFPQNTGLTIEGIMQWELTTSCGIFLLQLVAASLLNRSQPQVQSGVQIAHMILAHALILFSMFWCSFGIPLLRQYLGIGILLVAVPTLIAYLLLAAKPKSSAFAEVLLNLSIIVATIGIFLQVESSWSAILFLGYACAILWLSLYQQAIRTRIYGFLVLTISMVKLYLQFSGIFNEIPGTLAVLAIGVILVILSYKFQSLKHLVTEGIR